MIERYKIETTSDFDKSFKKLARRNNRLRVQVLKIFALLVHDPYYSSLKTHQVQSRKFGKVYSSRITGDLRILWKFKNEKAVILALTIGGHSGSNAVY